MKTNVLLVQESIVSYRLPVYNLIAEKVNLTIGYTSKSNATIIDKFEVVKLNKFTFKGFHIIKNNFNELCKNYDVVIIMADLHYLSYCLLPFLKRDYKVIPWAIGIRASYSRRYDVTRKKDLIDKIYLKLLQKSDAIIFYMAEAKKFWGNSLDKKSIFIAHNTAEVLNINLDFDINKKKSILFLGTLYKEKKIYELINAFIKAKEKFESTTFLRLDIIGKGVEFELILELIKKHNIENSVFLHGAIYEEAELAKFFNNAILCVSPDQAGLSVVKSMGYGVPFVTRTNAITGGERFNIINDENGLFYDKEEQLTQIIIKAYRKPEFFIEMGKRARDYYTSTTTIQNMADNVVNAINFSLK
mgnify:CR=1 FL=1